MQNPFVWAGNQAVDQKDLATRRALANALIGKSLDASPVQHWTQGLARVAQAIAGARQAQFADEDEARAKAGLSPDRNLIFGGGTSPDPASPTSVIPQQGPQNPVMAPKPNDVSATFLDTVKASGLANPNALAALGATGERESGWNASRANSTWSDPSESGQAGTSGGTLSWRADRLRALQDFARANGEQGNGSPATQAKFFMQEDPALVERLNAAKTPEEAMQHMNNAWRFAGYNRPGGEAAARIASAQKWAGVNQSQPGQTEAPMPLAGQREQSMGVSPQSQAAPVQVAQAGPGMPAATQGGAAQTPGGISQERVQAAYRIMNSPFAGAGDKAAAQIILQKALAAETKDPRDNVIKDQQVEAGRLGVEKTKRELGRVEMDTMQAPDGTVWEREKGKPGAEWKATIKLGQKPDTTTDQKELDQINRERVAQNQPPLRLDEWKLQKGKASAPAVNIDQKQESEFGKETGKAIAKRFDEMATEGDAAAQNLDAINQLKALGTNIGTGGPAVAKAFLGKIGIKTEGVSDIEAFNSLIDRLTPQQRVPGSGATSDFDAKMFKGSLPTLMNTPGGNAIIVDTMEKIVQNRMARGDIAIRAQLPKDDPDHLPQGQALRELRKLQAEARKASDAVQNFGQPNKGASPVVSAPQGTTPAAPASGGFRIISVQ